MTRVHLKYFLYAVALPFSNKRSYGALMGARKGSRALKSDRPPLLSSCVTLGKLLNLSDTSFPSSAKHLLLRDGIKSE